GWGIARAGRAGQMRKVRARDVRARAGGIADDGSPFWYEWQATAPEAPSRSPAATMRDTRGARGRGEGRRSGRRPVAELLVRELRGQLLASTGDVFVRFFAAGQDARRIDARPTGARVGAPEGARGPP